ncbi:hypothetical protein Q9R32_05730 [Actinotalea sp. AC32]|nr:hypothetical protein [Actinotalea sp. AC32]
MGRHSARPEPARPSGAGRGARARGAVPALVLGVVAAAAAAWSGTPWWTAALVGTGAAVVTLVATWVAARAPSAEAGPPPARRPGE